jgi:hypothetical protein
VTVRMLIATRWLHYRWGMIEHASPTRTSRRRDDAESAGGLGNECSGVLQLDETRVRVSPIREVGAIQPPNCSSTVWLVLRPHLL